MAKTILINAGNPDQARSFLTENLKRDGKDMMNTCIKSRTDLSSAVNLPKLPKLLKIFFEFPVAFFHTLCIIVRVQFSFCCRPMWLSW